jgi:hypothetical protein
MGTDQLDSTVCQPLSQGITISSPVTDEPTWYLRCDGLIEQRLNQRDFGRTGGAYVDSQWQAVPVDQEAEFGLAGSRMEWTGRHPNRFSPNGRS